MEINFNQDEQPKKQPFPVPNDYFDKLPNRIMQRVTSEQKSAWNWLPTLQAPLRMALASLLLLVTFIGVFYLSTNTTTETNKNQLAMISEQEIMNYLLTSDHLETSDLAELTTTNQDLTHYFIPASETEIE